MQGHHHGRVAIELATAIPRLIISTRLSDMHLIAARHIKAADIEAVTATVVTVPHVRVHRIIAGRAPLVVAGHDHVCVW